MADSVTPACNEDYLKTDYWDARFTLEEGYEWFKGYGAFRDILWQHLRPSDRVLILGCGNSSLSEDLYRDGITQLTSTDLSSVVVNRMRERCRSNGCEGISWQVADMTDLRDFGADAFDAVIEKGAMDVLFVDNESPWDPSERVRARVHAMLSEVDRVLGSSGVFLSITFGQPHFRGPLFETDPFTWALRYDTFGESFHYFVFILRKARPRDNVHKVGADIGLPAKDVLDMSHDQMDSADYLLRNLLLDEDKESS
eukprot:SM000146S00979  [mRNA]  locus=s146:231724:234146:+ [translate_table: standard]